MTTPAGWYDDGSGKRRWWDGGQWTDHFEQAASPDAVAALPQQYASAGRQVPLDQPLYGASFGEAVSRFWSKYATFSGRASPSEYWWAFLFFVLLAWVPLLNLAMIIPAIAVAVRRLHDTDRSGVYYLFSLIPFAGAIIMIVLLTGAPVPSGARYDLQARYYGGPQPGYPSYPNPSPGQPQ